MYAAIDVYTYSVLYVVLELVKERKPSYIRPGEETGSEIATILRLSKQMMHYHHQERDLHKRSATASYSEWNKRTQQDASARYGNTPHAENNTPGHEATVPSHAPTHAQPLTLFTTTLSSAAPKPCVSWTLLLIHPLLRYPRSHAPTAARAPSRRIRGLRSRCRAASASARTRILTSLACARPRAEA
jgi:hypothetical protein